VVVETRTSQSRNNWKRLRGIATKPILIDEVEQSIRGVQQRLIAVLASRMFGTFLSWLHDRESDTFVSVPRTISRRLPPEFGRSERI